MTYLLGQTVFNTKTTTVFLLFLRLSGKDLLSTSGSYILWNSVKILTFKEHTACIYIYSHHEDKVQIGNEHEEFYILGHNSVSSIDSQPTSRSYIPEYRSLHSHCCEYLKSNMEMNLFGAGLTDTAGWTWSYLVLVTRRLETEKYSYILNRFTVCPLNLIFLERYNQKDKISACRKTRNVYKKSFSVLTQNSCVYCTEGIKENGNSWNVHN
jgi:hypothetical protein